MSKGRHVEKLRRVDVSKFMEKLRQSMKEFKVLEPLEWILLMLYAANGKIPSKIHIQKALFIASRSIEELNEVLEFKAYRMGPWSEELSDALENAYLSGLVSEVEDGLILTEQGVVKAEELWRKLDERYREVLSDIARFVKNMSEDELLIYIYVVYGFSEKSDVVEKLLRRRRELAVSMFLKGLISVGLAAKIAGESLPKFIEYLRKKGIKPFEAEVSDIEEVEKISNI